MRDLAHSVLLLCLLLTGEAVGGLGLRRPSPQGDDEAELSGREFPNEAGDWRRSAAEVDPTTLTPTTFRLTNGTELRVSPLAPAPVYKHANGTRRQLGDFRECSPCTCCDSARRWCLPTVCCYDINCGVRGLPFGLCSFTPISCTCLGCRD